MRGFFTASPSIYSFAIALYHGHQWHAHPAASAPLLLLFSLFIRLPLGWRAVRVKLLAERVTQPVPPLFAHLQLAGRIKTAAFTVQLTIKPLFFT